ncbi:hypothetical protein KIP88_13105 [Bradyrhizobium sp. SRL28]|uniref:hypothetical protein n=1 Tax=Bradyrhizobium sp. SRL28 TaxID=2836178 RepID=UPI001BDEC88B|nr:hypothetical protein [Bradyrhizobium sp. SRL28]MBT1511446.1 hypothetical protein [Bradyrhizobium sp. SRL28]
MTRKFPAASKLAMSLAAAALVAIGTTSASAQSRQQYDRDGRPYYGANGPNRSYQQGPRTRVYVTTRSWLDAGTEVLPGDRKFQDYAFPSDFGYPTFARENLNRPIDRQPLNPPSDMGGFPTRFPLY